MEKNSTSHQFVELAPTVEEKTHDHLNEAGCSDSGDCQTLRLQIAQERIQKLEDYP